MSGWKLPTSVTVCGQEFAIRSDYRAVLDAISALRDPELSPQEQTLACLEILYPDWKRLPDLSAAAHAAMVFINCGKPVEAAVPKPALVDWDTDAAIMAPAVDKVLGYSCRRCAYLHWWEFIGAFGCIGDGQFAQERQKAGQSRAGICAQQSRSGHPAQTQADQRGRRIFQKSGGVIFG